MIFISLPAQLIYKHLPDVILRLGGFEKPSLICGNRERTCAEEAHMPRISVVLKIYDPKVEHHRPLVLATVSNDGLKHATAIQYECKSHANYPIAQSIVFHSIAFGWGSIRVA